MVRLATKSDAADIADIYNQGIEERIATFETAPRSARDVETQLVEKDERYPTIVVEQDGRVIAWASAGRLPERGPPTWAWPSTPCTWPATRAARGQVSRRARCLGSRVRGARGFWKLVSRIFPENTGSLALHARAGFRVVGVYHRHGQLDGQWRDCVIVEKLLGPATAERPQAT